MKNKNGFTLIELLSTLIILGIIATIAIQSYNMLVIKNDNSKYKYYWNFIEKASDLYFDARKINMIPGECFSVNYQALVDKDYLKEEGVTCTGNIILRKQNKKYVYDDTNLECKSNNKIVNEKVAVEAVCPVTGAFTFDDNYERANDIATPMTASIDKWNNVSTTHTVKKAYDLASSKNISFTECTGECGIYQNLTKTLVPDKTYSFSVQLKANSGKTLKVGVGTNGMKTITTTGAWQKVSGDFVATSTDSSKFSILSTTGWQENEEIYLNSVIVYEKNQSLKNKLAFEIDVPFGDGLPKPTRAGYQFTGWFTESSGGVQITKDTIVPKTKNIIYYAHWTKKNAKVNYLANGGIGTMTSDTVTYGNDYTIKNNAFTNTGYTFDYWKDKDNNKNFSIWSETPITWTYDKEINLSAIWTANKYTVTFNPNGGSVSETSRTVTYDTKYDELPTPTREGYTFNGWYTSASGGVKITASTVVSLTGNQTLYAQWTAKKFTVTFNANGGSVSTSSKNATYDSAYGTLPTPTRTGYVFIGWFDEKYKDNPLNYYADTYSDLYNGYGYNETNLYNHYINYGKNEGRRISQYLDTDIVKKENSHTLYAGWKANTYTIKYISNGGSGTMANKTATYDSTHTISANSFTRTGYTFVGWTTNSNGTDDGYNWTNWSGTWKYVNGQYGISNGTLTLYARWVASVVAHSSTGSHSASAVGSTAATWSFHKFDKVYTSIPTFSWTGGDDYTSHQIVAISQMGVVLKARNGTGSQQWPWYTWKVTGNAYNSVPNGVAQNGSIDVGGVSRGSRNYTVTYPIPYTKPPKLYVVNHATHYSCSVSVVSQSATGFTVKHTNSSSSTQYDAIIWMAVDSNY